jgi:hypothetical protein
MKANGVRRIRNFRKVDVAAMVVRPFWNDDSGEYLAAGLAAMLADCGFSVKDAEELVLEAHNDEGDKHYTHWFNKVYEAFKRFERGELRDYPRILAKAGLDNLTSITLFDIFYNPPPAQV